MSRSLLGFGLGQHFRHVQLQPGKRTKKTRLQCPCSQSFCDGETLVRSPAGSAEITRQVEIFTLSSHQMAPAGVVAHSSSWTLAAYELEESRRRRTRTSADFQNFLMDEGSKETKLSSFRRVRPLASRRGTGAVHKYWNWGLTLIASGHCVSFLPVSVPHGRCVGVLGLRIVVLHDVAASLVLTVAAPATDSGSSSGQFRTVSNWGLSRRRAVVHVTNRCQAKSRSRQLVVLWPCHVPNSLGRPVHGSYTIH